MPQPSHLQHLRLWIGRCEDLCPLLQLCQHTHLTLTSVPAVSDALQRTRQCELGGLPWLEKLWFDVSKDVLAGAIPGALRLQLPVSSTLRVLHIDCARTDAGVELDDRALLTITTSCQHLRDLKVRALLTFGDNAGASLRNLHELQGLMLWDTRWQTVWAMLRLAACGLYDVAHEPELQQTAYWQLQRAYYTTSATAIFAAAASGGDLASIAGAVLGLAAVTLPTIVKCWQVLIPRQSWQAGQLCALAAGKARQAAFAVRPCWLPLQLRVLQLHDCALCCHKGCGRCHAQQGQPQQQLLVQQLPLQFRPDWAASTLASSSSYSKSSSSSVDGLDAASMRAAVLDHLDAGRRSGLYPVLWQLARRVILSPVVPFAVTALARICLRHVAKMMLKGVGWAS
jgi:hypothetical protein